MYFQLKSGKRHALSHGQNFCYDGFVKIIDVHTHGIGGYDVRTADPDHILKMAEIQGGYGVTHIVPTIYPGPIAEMRKGVAAVKAAMERQGTEGNGQKVRGSEKTQGSDMGHTPPPKPLGPTLGNQNPPPAVIAGIHLEGPFLNPSRAGALDRASFLKPTEESFRGLIEGFEDSIRIITISPELEGSADLIRTMSAMGIRVNMGHSDATHSEAEAGFHSGARCITHIFNAMRPIHHREPGIAGFGLLCPEIYIEVIADPFHLHPKTLDLVFKVKNPEKIIIVSDTVKETAIVTQNHGIWDRNGTLQGGSMTITESAQRLIDLGFHEPTVVASISANPWSYLLPQ